MPQPPTCMAPSVPHCCFLTLVPQQPGSPGLGIGVSPLFHSLPLVPSSLPLTLLPFEPELGTPPIGSLAESLACVGPYPGQGHQATPWNPVPAVSLALGASA